MIKCKCKGRIGYIQLSRIKVPTNVVPTKHESNVIDNFNNFFESIGCPINISINGTIYKDISFALQVKKGDYGLSVDPKADILLCSDIKNPINKNTIYISQKRRNSKCI